MTQPPTGTLIGVGVGPGDPELLTIKAVKAIQTADVIAFHARPGGVSAAKTIATNYLSDNHELELLEYPVTTGIVDHPGGYAGAMADFYLEATTRLAAHLAAGKTVAVLTLGDLGTEQGLLGGINAMIVGNYLTTLGRPMENDLDMLDKLRIPLKVLTTSV